MHSLEEEGVCIDLSLPNALVLALLILDSILTELLELSLEVSPLKLPFPVGVTIVVRVLVTTFPPGSVLVCVATEVTGSAVVDWEVLRLVEEEVGVASGVVVVELEEGSTCSWEEEEGWTCEDEGVEGSTSEEETGVDGSAWDEEGVGSTEEEGATEEADGVTGSSADESAEEGSALLEGEIGFEEEEEGRRGFEEEGVAEEVEDMVLVDSVEVESRSVWVVDWIEEVEVGKLLLLVEEVEDWVVDMDKEESSSEKEEEEEEAWDKEELLLLLSLTTRLELIDVWELVEVIELSVVLITKIPKRKTQ